MLLDRLKKSKLYQQEQGDNRGQNSDTGAASSANQEQEQEVDVTDDIQKLLAYVTKKSEDDPHDGVLSRIKSRMKDIVESLMGDNPTTSPSMANHNQPPTTPSVTIPNLPQFKFVRKRGGRIVKRPVQKQEVTK